MEETPIRATGFVRDGAASVPVSPGRPKRLPPGDPRLPYTAYDKLLKAVVAVSVDYQLATSGNKSATRRTRRVMRQVKKICDELAEEMIRARGIKIEKPSTENGSDVIGPYFP